MSATVSIIEDDPLPRISTLVEGRQQKEASLVPADGTDLGLVVDDWQNVQQREASWRAELEGGEAETHCTAATESGIH